MTLKSRLQHLKERPVRAYTDALWSAASPFTRDFVIAAGDIATSVNGDLQAAWAGNREATGAILAYGTPQVVGAYRAARDTWERLTKDAPNMGGTEKALRSAEAVLYRCARNAALAWTGTEMQEGVQQPVPDYDVGLPIGAAAASDIARVVKPLTLTREIVKRRAAKP
ncbi:MAG: hypothetical protein OXR66_09615 [Candidatus Woesearchaeota archaeon]|nr:hypothetical protein [Candidatus Woesearchaeota archaeon]